MDFETLLTLVVGAGAAGLGLGGGFRLFPLIGSFQGMDYNPAAAAEVRCPARNSSLLGFHRNALRASDGSYVKGWRAKPETTILLPGELSDTRCDSLARFLAIKKPVGTTISFRYATDVDTGILIRRHRGEIGENRVPATALALHDAELSHLEKLAAVGLYRRTGLTVWARVPGVAGESRSWRSEIVKEFVRSFRRPGDLALNAVSLLNELRDDAVLRRLENDEDAALEEAEKWFRQFERQCPLGLQPLDMDETFAALYLGHNQDARSVPEIGSFQGLDLRDYLCGEKIQYGAWYALHGRTPVAMVSMFVPPQPEITGDVLRVLLSNPSLAFRHILSVEFVYVDQDKVKSRFDRRLRQIRKAARTLDGRPNWSPEGERARTEIESVRSAMTAAGEAVLAMRFYALIQGRSAETQDDLRRSVKDLERSVETFIAAVRTMPGADAGREEPEAVHSLYERCLIGESDLRPTGREIEETADTLARLVPTESDWEGNESPHTIVETVGGRLTGLNLFSTKITSSPLALVVGAMGSGKSVLMGSLALDVLACFPNARVRTVDFGESFGRLVSGVQGRHFRFSPDREETVNIWDYPGLASGTPPDELQMELVVGDLLRLARVRADDEIADRLLKVLVRQVYDNVVPMNGPGVAKVEPLLSHLLDLLSVYPFKSRTAAERAQTLALALEDYRNHPWLDRPTSECFEDTDSPWDNFELDSLVAFPRDVRASIGYRTAVRITQAIGRIGEDGTRAATLLGFDEMHKLKPEFPEILDPLRKGSRQGRKERVLTVIGTHTFDDVADMPEIVANAGYKIIGRQEGDIGRLVRAFHLCSETEAAVRSIGNIDGAHREFVIVIGSGPARVVEHVRTRLSPIRLWLQTTHPVETNALRRIARLRPDWTSAQQAAFLAEHYPSGLVLHGLTEINEGLVPRLSREDMIEAEAAFPATILR